MTSPDLDDEDGISPEELRRISDAVWARCPLGDCSNCLEDDVPVGDVCNDCGFLVCRKCHDSGFVCDCYRCPECGGALGVDDCSFCGKEEEE